LRLSKLYGSIDLLTDLAQLSSLIEHALRGQEGVCAAYLFGSFAQGRATERSDVDIALVLEEGRGALARAVIVQDSSVAISRAAPQERFDVHDLQDLPVAVAGRALNEGKLLFERDAAVRVRAEVAVRMAYHDFAWYEQDSLQEGLAGLRRRFGDG
jgi:uncharacterized protein